MCECKKNDKYQVWCAYGPKLQSELAADANMTSVRRKRSTSRRRGRPPQMPSRRCPSPHHLEGCYERGHNDGLCQGVYDKGKLDGYNEGRHAHVWHGDEDNEDERPSWTAVRRGRNDSESSDSGSGDSEDTSTSGSSESERSEDSEDGDDDKRRRERIYEKIAELEEELAELGQSDHEADKPHPTDG